MRFLTQALIVFALMLAIGAGANGPSNKQEDDGKLVLGHVGQVLKDTAVLVKPDVTSKAYFTVKEKDYLVVKVEAPKGWAKVLLNTGRYGYILADAVQPLDYEVTAKEKPRPTQMYLASRNETGRAIAADRGLNFIGTPYKWGGNDIQNGIDCSGFVQQLFGSIGISLPRTAAQQAMVGTPITRLEDLRKGDRLYFWDYKRNMIGHTGIYLGGGKFVQSSSGHGGVNVDDLRNGNWLKLLVAARR